MKILLGVGGGIAAFKVAALCSRLVQDGHSVRVAMSRSSRAFIGERTFEGLTGQAVIGSSTQVDPDGRVPHVTDARNADVLVIAPATADLIAKLAAGVCDDPVSLAAVCCLGRRIVCPAMNDSMWLHPATQRNVETLRELGYEIIGPVEGWLAEGYASIGRMVEPEEILTSILSVRFRMDGTEEELEEALGRLHLIRRVRAAVLGDSSGAAMTVEPSETVRHCDVLCDAPVPDLSELGGQVRVEELPLDHGGLWTGLEEDGVIEVADDLWVRPPWVEAPSDRSGIELVVPRGSAFGSGEADSTRVTLQLLHRVWDGLSPRSVLDVGSGSGILAAYAQARGVDRLAACDVDPMAVSATASLLPQADVREGGAGEFEPETFDLVLANLSGEQIQQSLDEMMARVAPGGALCVGGQKDHELQALLERTNWSPQDQLRGETFHTVLVRF
ncbi:MAG: flavoprotein [Planctomycetota bacterium]